MTEFVRQTLAGLCNRPSALLNLFTCVTVWKFVWNFFGRIGYSVLFTIKHQITKKSSQGTSHFKVDALRGYKRRNLTIPLEQTLGNRREGKLHLRVGGHLPQLVVVWRGVEKTKQTGNSKPSTFWYQQLVEPRHTITPQVSRLKEQGLIFTLFGTKITCQTCIWQRQNVYVLWRGLELNQKTRVGVWKANRTSNISAR